MTPRAFFLSVILAASAAVTFAKDSEDVIVYGATPGGIAAALGGK